LAGVARDVQQLMQRELPGQYMRAGPRLKLTPIEGVRRAVG
ncbi:MAG: hypothetical protein JWP41_2618, partial [Ramlibacter sp.]|nr:hypothetical protein [Ramlibacter sp.]